MDFGLNWNDYGARFYDPAMARWSGIDPLAIKYPNNSGYNYTLNNPIKYIDPDGRDNILYILTLPGVSKELVNKAIANANEYLKTMGLSTQVVKASSSFDISKLDATDGMFLVGNTPSQVTNYFNDNKYVKGVVGSDFSNQLKEWEGNNSGNTETTTNNLGVVSTDRLGAFIEEVQGGFTVNKEDALGFMMVHSMGHQAGFSHHKEQLSQIEAGFMADGSGSQLQPGGPNSPVYTVGGLATLFKGANGSLIKYDAPKNINEIFNGQAKLNGRNVPRTPQYIIDLLKNRFQPNNQKPTDHANPPKK